MQPDSSGKPPPPPPVSSWRRRCCPSACCRPAPPPQSTTPSPLHRAAKPSNALRTCLYLCGLLEDDPFSENGVFQAQELLRESAGDIARRCVCV